jgi:hypothetical protein
MLKVQLVLHHLLEVLLLLAAVQARLLVLLPLRVVLAAVALKLLILAALEHQGRVFRVGMV